ncbi:MAG: hypothetical protein OEX81_02105 [Candidatus Pacebacteria bacterium]|nr:hypothetical protein [Candidatus Paceibacterota bacterium]
MSEEYVDPKKVYTTENAVREMLKSHTKNQIVEFGVEYIQKHLLKKKWPATYAISKSLAAFVFIMSGKDIDEIKKQK